MASLPNQLAGVSFEFAGGTVNEITDEILEGLAAVIKPNAEPYADVALFLQRQAPPETWPNRHSTCNAVNISRVNI